MAARRRELPYCSVCRTHYRSSFPVHASTTKHQRAVFRRDHPRQKVRSNRRQAAARAWRVSRVDPNAAFEDHVSVSRHRRSRPDDGRAKVVRIKSYQREPPYHRGGLSLDHARELARRRRLYRRRHPLKVFA